MTQNPYAQMGAPGQPPFGGGYGGDFGGPPVESRISALAVASLVLSLICCIPGLGLLGVLLGVPAVFAINKSRGRLRGTGLAIGGIVVGLLVTLLWIFIIIGVGQGMGMYRTQFVQPIGTVVEGITTQDRTVARSMFTPATNAAVSDADLDNFAAAIQSHWGAYQGIAPTGWELVRDYATGGQTMQRYQQRQQPGQPPIVPVPLRFDRGVAIFLAEMDDSAPPPQGVMMPPLLNIGFLDPQGNEVWLRDPATITPAPGGRRPLPAPGTPPPPDGGPPPAETPEPAPTPPPGD